MHPIARQSALQQRHVERHARSSDSHAFFNLLTGPELFDKIESLLPAHRERLFPPTETLSMFLAQALSQDRSCQNAVDEAAMKRLVGQLPLCSTHTGAYCRARARLPVDLVRTLSCYTGRWIVERAPRSWRWRGRAVRLVDGTTLTMPDTKANQSAYPQSRSQKPGLGFARCRLVGIVCLGTGAILNGAIGPYQGKGSGELSLLRTMLDSLERGDVLLGDALYATYFLLCALRERGVDALFEQHGPRQRTTDFRRGRRLGPRDHLMVLQKPTKKPDWMSLEDYQRTPQSLRVREVRVGKKTLVSTLLDPKQSTKEDLGLLYRSRWHVELDLRNIKATLGMGHLSCLSSEMAAKEIWVYLLAYNLIRLMMAQAALLANLQPRQLSFKHTVQVWIAWNHHGQSSAPEVLDGLFVLIAQGRVGNRPGRIEPRVIKRRSILYPLLTKPREIARARVRRLGHPKGAK